MYLNRFYRRTALIAILGLIQLAWTRPALLGQVAPEVTTEAFTVKYIVPEVFSDPNGRSTVDQMMSGVYDSLLQISKSPFLSLGEAPSNWWMRFRVFFNPIDTTKKARTVILWTNPRNFDKFRLWNTTSGKPRLVDSLGSKIFRPGSFSFTNGYYTPITLVKGENTFWAQVNNDMGNIHMALQVYSTEHFAIFNRQNMLWYGIFTGAILLSILFASQLYRIDREKTYLAYIGYIVAISIREMYNFSIFIHLSPNALRHTISFFITATFGIFLMYFLRLKQRLPFLYRIVRIYIGVMLACGILFPIFVKARFFDLAEAMVVFYIATNLGFVSLALLYAVWTFKDSPRSRIVVFAYTPLAVIFLLNLLKNLRLVPNFPSLQYAVMAGVLLEIAVFTVAFIRMHKYLVEQVIYEQQSAKIAVREAEQRVKDQVARDLHDDVAATMSSIRVLSLVAKEKFKKNAPDVENVLDQIKSSAESSVESISDLIWSVKGHENYLNDMADRMREYAVKLLEAKNIDFQLDIPRNFPALDLDIVRRRNLYFIFKECVNNAIKHSKASAIDISLRISGNLILFSIVDNGIGFDPDKVDERGLGIKSIRKRALEINADLHLKSIPGRGTKVEFICPLHESAQPG